ncbi:MAG: hypothetical protein SFT93_00460 [Rickettsiaceae bacterium]|nr:hypothetical protein [Rickettsiaceae bacterium]
MSILIYGNRLSVLNQDIFGMNRSITHTFYGENISSQKFDIIISFMDMHMISDIKLFMQTIDFQLKNDGIFIGVLPGGRTLLNTRNKLWQLEEKSDNKFANRILPMIRLEDINQILSLSGFKNIISFKEDFIIKNRNILWYLGYIRKLGENSLFTQGEQISKVFYSNLLKECDIYNEFLEILAFCASRTTKLFASQIKL